VILAVLILTRGNGCCRTESGISERERERERTGRSGGAGKITTHKIIIHHTETCSGQTGLSAIDI
jgi:hypothetical protein